MIKLKYQEMMGFAFSQAMQKIASTPTHGEAASQIHKVTRQLERAKKDVMKEFQTKIAEVYGKRDEAGKLIRPEGEAMGFEPIEEKEKELEKAQEDFGQGEVEIHAKPFTIQLLGGFKISAQDLAGLHGLYDGNTDEEAPVAAKPPLPARDNVASLR